MSNSLRAAPRRGVWVVVLSAWFATQVIGQQGAAPPKPIPLEAVLADGNPLVPKLPTMLWLPSGTAIARVITDAPGDTEEGEQVLIQIPVDGSAESEIARASAVWTVLEASGLDVAKLHQAQRDAKLVEAMPAEPAQAPELQLPPFTFEGDRELRFEVGGFLWQWPVGGTLATKLVELAADSAARAIAPDAEAAAFVVDHDIVVHRITGERRQITWDGKAEDIVYGGAAHRAEFGIVDGMWWDPTGRYLAFSREDKRPIDPYPYIDYRQTPPLAIHGRYPMAGRTHSKVQIGVYDRQDDSVRFLDNDADEDLYWTNVTFAPDGSKTYVALVNRGQDRCDLVRFDTSTGAREATLFTERDEQWVEPEHGPMFAPDAKSFLWFSARDGFNHLYHYGLDGQLLGRITHGPFDIRSFEGFSSDGKTGYLTSSGPTPLVMHLWSFPFGTTESSDQDDTGNDPATVIAPVVTTSAELVPSNAPPAIRLTRLTQHAAWHTPRVNLASGHVLDAWSDLQTPPQLDLLRRDGSVATLAITSDPFDEYTVGHQQFFRVAATADEQLSLYGHVIFPPGLNPDRPVFGRTYPVLHYVYGGPHSQLVRQTWGGGANPWLHFLASQGYIVTRIDGRGTDNRGIDFAQAIHRNVGALEVRDQLAAVDWVQQFQFVDRNRVGIHGWSYGGYLTLRLMLMAPDRFRCGIAGAPVTDWARYETGYTERYMDTPDENPEGYAAASTLPLVKQLRGRLLLVHGSHDQTVMYSHSMAFAQECIDQDVLIDFMPYPMQLHGLRGQSRKHLYRKMTRYIRDHLGR